jgi:uncharacterized protein
MQCPICKKEVVKLSEGERSFYPFCSERCKLIDLGRWLGEKYQIPVARDDESHDGESAANPDSEQ